MRSVKDIERSFKQANLGVEINAEHDRRVLGELVEVQCKSPSSHATWRLAPRSWALRLAAVVAIVTVIALLVGRHDPPRAEQQTVSRIELATAISLEKAYRQGGVEAVESQYREAFGASRRDTKTPSVDELLTHLEDEMKDL